MKRQTVRRPIDYVGLGLLITWVGALQIVFDNGENYDWFQSSFIVTFALIAFVGFVCFLAWELTDEHPIVDLRIFRHRGFMIATVAMFFAFSSFMGSNVLIPLWLQTNMAYTATTAGQMMAFNGLVAVMCGADRRQFDREDRSPAHDVHRSCHRGAGYVLAHQLQHRHDILGACSGADGAGLRHAAVLHSLDEHFDEFGAAGRDRVGGRPVRLSQDHRGSLRHRRDRVRLARCDGAESCPDRRDA